MDAMKDKDTLIQISQVVTVFAVALPFTYFFSTRVGGLLFGSLDGALVWWQLGVLLGISEIGLLMGAAYATLLWIMAMKYFLRPDEIEDHLTRAYVPVISEGVQKIFEFACPRQTVKVEASKH